MELDINIAAEPEVLRPEKPVTIMAEESEAECSEKPETTVAEELAAELPDKQNSQISTTLQKLKNYSLKC